MKKHGTGAIPSLGLASLTTLIILTAPVIATAAGDCPVGLWKTIDD